MSFSKASKSKNQIYSYNRVRRFLGKFGKKIVTKSREKFTIMFIPHSDSKIFHLQISHLTFFLLLSMIIALIIIGAFSYQKINETSKDIVIRNRQIIENVSDLNQYIYLTPVIREEVDNVYNHTDDVLFVSGLKNRLQLRYLGGPLTATDRVINPEALSRNNQSLRIPEINELAGLTKKLRQTQYKLNGLTVFLRGQQNLLKNIPSISPVFGGGDIIISGFGWRRDPFTYTLTEHTGVDIINTPLTPIQATADGIVIKAEYGGTRGLYVEIQHQFGFSTQYLHLDEIRVEPGTAIKKGDIIGDLGNTGRSTGYHLHYEVRINNHPVNPEPYVALDKFYRGQKK